MAEDRSTGVKKKWPMGASSSRITFTTPGGNAPPGYSFVYSTPDAGYVTYLGDRVIYPDGGY